MAEHTLEQLLIAISLLPQIFNKVENIERQISITSTPEGRNTDSWLSLDELCAYLPGKPAKATVYGLVQQRAIPHKKFGKRLAFLKSEIDSWINAKDRKTVDATKAEASNYLVKKKGAKK